MVGPSVWLTSTFHKARPLMDSGVTFPGGLQRLGCGLPHDSPVLCPGWRSLSEGGAWVGGQLGCGDCGGLRRTFCSGLWSTGWGLPRRRVHIGHCTPRPPAIWTEPELALWGLRCPQLGLDFSWGAPPTSSRQWGGGVYAFYSSSSRCPCSLRTEIRTRTLPVNIRCAWFYSSFVGGSINLLAAKFLRKFIPSGCHYSQLLFWGAE